MRECILAIDQGTTSTRAMVFSPDLAVLAQAQQEFTQIYPRPGEVEHDAQEIWITVQDTCRAALARAQERDQAVRIASIGIANQRETVVVWDRKSGKPIHNAIVWQDRRTADRTQALSAAGLAPLFAERTGLLPDPYFSGTKLAWILDHVPGARSRAESGELLFGTIDSWLVWNLTGGRVHATDATNASRTLMFDIRRNCWDHELLEHLKVPSAMLPHVRDCADDYGTTAGAPLASGIPINGVAGDQQAALIGQACFTPGMMKSTYGTGCFAILNTGESIVRSKNRLLTTIGYRLNGKTTYALEGSIFVAGAAVQWLRDGLGILKDAAETQALAERADPDQQVILVPAFVGLGAPHWRAEARGAIFGLTRNSGPAELARAALESAAYQTRDLLEAMQGDWHERDLADAVLRVDGGMTASDWAMAFLADMLAMPVDRAAIQETTALGAAWLAGWRAGICPDPERFAAHWSLDRRFLPAMDDDVRRKKYAAWQKAVTSTI